MFNGLLSKILKKIFPNYISNRYIQSHMEAAYVYSKLSHCARRKVGAVVVKDNTIISIGYNGSPAGWDNCCEDKHGVSMPHIIHAEKNSILKLAGSVESAKGASIYVTTEPCLECATLIYGSGITNVYWSEQLRTNPNKGLEFLKKCKIKTKRVVI